MTDTVMRAAGHVASAGGGAGLVAWLSRVLQARESQAVATELALLRNDVSNLSKAIAKHENVNERLALVESSLKAVHDRMDRLDPKSRRQR